MNSPTAMAIQGNGFFVLQDPNGVQTFSRNGQVSENSNGALIGFNGSELLGYPVNSSGVAGAVLAPIVIPRAYWRLPLRPRTPSAAISMRPARSSRVQSILPTLLPIVPR